MRIRALNLINFKSIYTGMKKKEITIIFDTDEIDKEIVLLVGPNGSGKTSILSQLQPFPYVGNLDVRNSQDPIIEGEIGRKRIVITTDKKVYSITHTYKPQTNGSHKVICSIKLNDVELNPTGQVKSFYDIIYDEFGLTPAFLKIMRLGYNVTGIIDMNATDRKNFISFFLNEVEPYQEANKVVKEVGKSVKNKIKYVTENLKNIKTDDTTTEEIANAIKKVQIHIDENKKNLDEVNNTLKTLEGFDDESVQKLKDEYSKIFNNTQIYKKYNFASEDEAKSKINEYSDLIHKCEHYITNADDTISGVKDNIYKVNENINKLTSEIEDTKNKSSLLDYSSSNISKLEELAKDYEKQINEINSERIDDVNYLDKPKYQVVYNNIYRIWKILDSVFEYDNDIYIYIRKMYEESKYRNLKSDLSYTDKVSMIINEIYRKIDNKISVNKITNVNDDNVLIISTPPKGCSNFIRCPFYQIYVDSIRNGADKDIEFYINAKNILNAFNKTFDMYIAALADLNLEFYNNSAHRIEFVRTFLKRDIRYIKSIGDRVLEIINWCENMGKLESLKEALKNINQQLEEAREADKAKTEYSNKIKILENEKRAMSEKHNTLTKDLEIFEAKRLNLVNSKNAYGKEKDIISDYLINKDKYTELESKYKLAKKRNENYLLYIKAREKLEDKIREYEDQLKQLANKLADKNFNDKLSESLENEKKDLDDNYEDIMLLENATSNTKGIPLIFIRLYLKNIQVMANDIIHEMFSEDISLLDFHITEKEFTIPYINNGIEIQDISLASQGEKSCFIIALSFAIIRQLYSSYNILLIDELDGPLYKENKEKFISIIDKQMSKLGCEQLFIITHNNIFENYPISLIETAPGNSNAYNNAKRIPISSK